PRHRIRQRGCHFPVGKNDADHACRCEKDLIDIATEKFGGATSNALRSFQSRTAGHRIRATRIDDNRLHAPAGFFQRRFGKHHWRGLKSILREDRRRVRAALRHDEAEVGTLLANAGANARSYKSFGELQPTLPAIFLAASFTCSGAVPPKEFFFARIPSSVTPYSFASLSIDANCCPTLSCASRKGMPLVAIASATAVAISIGPPAAARMRSRFNFNPPISAPKAGSATASVARIRKSGSLSSCRSLSYASGIPL